MKNALKIEKNGFLIQNHLPKKKKKAIIIYDNNKKENADARFSFKEKTMLFALLTSGMDASSSGTTATGGCFSKENLPMTLIMLALLAVMIVFMFLSRRSQAKKQKEQMDMLNAIQPGNKVKTIGGICGVVVEVCPEDNTFVMETGTEASGKSYLKFDKQAIYQTDAVPQPVQKQEAVEEAPAVEAEEPVENTVEEPAENTSDEE